MEISLSLHNPDEMEAFAAFLSASAKSRRGFKSAFDVINEAVRGPSDEASLTREADEATPEPAEIPVSASAEPVKRTRRTKAEIEAANKATETVANLDPEVVAEAAAAGVNVQGPAETEAPGHTDLMISPEAIDAALENEPELSMGQEEQPALTENDVRNSIIDVLNEAQSKFPNDADIRTKTLQPLLKKLGAPKISAIPMTEYHRVAGLLAEVRQQMAEAA